MSESPTLVVDVALLAFAQRYANTLLKRDLLALFGENPHIGDDATGITRRLGRAESAVSRELEDLRLLGLLRRSRSLHNAAYQLTEDPDLRACLARFLQNYHKPRLAGGS